MTDITDPAAVRWSNERARPLADLVAGAFQGMVLYAQAWDSKGMGSLIPDDNSVVDDGSAVDGRTPITGHDLHELRALVTDLVAMGAGQNSRMPTVLKASVNPRVN